MVLFKGLNSENSQASEKVMNLMTEIRALQEIIAKFKTIQVDATEYACLKGIVLFKTGRFLLLYNLSRLNNESNNSMSSVILHKN